MGVYDEFLSTDGPGKQTLLLLSSAYVLFENKKQTERTDFASIDYLFTDRVDIYAYGRVNRACPCVCVCVYYCIRYEYTDTHARAYYIYIYKRSRTTINTIRNVKYLLFLFVLFYDRA